MKNTVHLSIVGKKTSQKSLRYRKSFQQVYAQGSSIPFARYLPLRCNAVDNILKQIGRAELLLLYHPRLFIGRTVQLASSVITVERCRELRERNKDQFDMIEDYINSEEETEQALMFISCNKPTEVESWVKEILSFQTKQDVITLQYIFDAENKQSLNLAFCMMSLLGQVCEIEPETLYSKLWKEMDLLVRNAWSNIDL